MFMSKIKQSLPPDWTWSEGIDEEYKLVEICVDSLESLNIKRDAAVSKAYRIENPFLYAQYLIKKDEYLSNGNGTEKKLYHCTGQSNVDSIAKTNLDYRRVSRCKFGQGVSFSPNMKYANKQASRSIGSLRAMLICDVLIGKTEIGDHEKKLPAEDYNTTTDKWSYVYVKCYDNEFYPKYAIYYELLQSLFI